MLFSDNIFTYFIRERVNYMNLQKVQYDVVDGIAVITMNWAKNLNAIDETMASELLEVLDSAQNDDNVKVVVLKGLTKAFSAGGDIGYFYHLIQKGEKVDMEDLISKVGVLTERVKRLDKLVIASVSGAAAGAGASLALSSDFIVCADNARFLMAFVNMGLATDTGGMYLLSKQVGEKLAMELCITGRPLDAQEAKERGIVYNVVPAAELEVETMKLAGKLAAGPLVAYKHIKRQAYAAVFGDYRNYLDNVEGNAQRICSQTADFAEGVAAFIEKRKPQYQGK